MVVNARSRTSASNTKEYLYLPEDDRSEDETKKQRVFTSQLPGISGNTKFKSVQSFIHANRKSVIAIGVAFVLLLLLFSTSQNYASNDVALRIVLFTTARPLSLNRLIKSLQQAEYSNDRVDIDVFISPFPRKLLGRRPVDPETIEITKSFKWRYGLKKVHVYNQSMDITQHALHWPYPEIESDEIVLFIQDNIEVSKYFWKWLKIAHQTYSNRPDVAGFTLSHIRQRKRHKTLKAKSQTVMSPLVEHMNAYSPLRDHWTNFQIWAKEYLQKNQGKKRSSKRSSKFSLPALHLRYALNHKDKQTIFANLPEDKALASRFGENNSVQGRRDYDVLKEEINGLLQFPAEPAVITATGQIQFYYQHPEMFASEDAGRTSATQQDEVDDEGDGKAPVEVETAPEDSGIAPQEQEEVNGDVETEESPDKNIDDTPKISADYSAFSEDAKEDRAEAVKTDSTDDIKEAAETLDEKPEVETFKKGKNGKKKKRKA